MHISVHCTGSHVHSYIPWLSCSDAYIRWRVTEKSAFLSGNKPYNILTELTIALCAVLVIFATLCTYVVTHMAVAILLFTA